MSDNGYQRLGTYKVTDTSSKTEKPALSNVPVTNGMASLCKPKPRTSSYLDKDHVATNGMFFQNMTDAMAAMSLCQWRSPTNDASMPQDDGDDREVVQQLVAAIKDTTKTVEKENNHYRKRVNPAMKEYYQDWAIENCAWQILAYAKDIHTNGCKVPMYDRTLMDAMGQTQLWIFQERIDYICLVLKTSKSTVASLMKNEKMSTIVGAPHKVFTASIVNNESNANRNRWIKEGRALDANHPPNRAKDLNQNPDDDSSPEKSRPNGRRRRIFDEYMDIDNENSSPSFSTGGLAGLAISKTDKEDENEMANDNDFSSDTEKAYMNAITAPITPSMAYGEATASYYRPIAPALPTFTPINAPTTPTTTSFWMQTVMQQDGDSEMADEMKK